MLYLRRLCICFTFLLNAFLSTTSFAQYEATHKKFSSFILNYNLPLSKPGLSVNSFRLTPRIRLDVYEKAAWIFLDIDLKQGSADDPDPGFTHSYNFMGKQYGNQHLGFDAFRNIRADPTMITYEVLVTYGSQSFGWKKVLGTGNRFGPIDPKAKAADVNVHINIVSIGSFNNTTQIENKIRELLAAERAAAIKTDVAKKTVINTTDQIISSNSKTQKNVNPSSGIKTAAKPGVGNGTSGNKITGLPNQTARSGPVIVNKEEMQVFRQNGKNYIQKADGSVIETSQQAYDYISAKAEAKKTNLQQAIEQQQKQQELQNKANHDAYLAQQALNVAKAEKLQSDIQIATQVIGLATEIFGELKADRERKLRLQREEQTRILEQARIANNLRKQKISARKAFLGSISDAPFPLSADKLKADQVYYFAYSYNIDSLEDNPKIFLSNIFPISKFDDDTWPYAPDIKKEIIKASNYKPNTTTIGYYTSKEEAETDYETFKKNLGNHDCSILSFTYNGKPARQNQLNDKSLLGELDFWGNPIKKIN